MWYWIRSRSKRGPTEGESLDAVVATLRKLGVSQGLGSRMEDRFLTPVRRHFLPSRSLMSSKKPLAIPAVSTIPSAMW